MARGNRHLSNTSDSCSLFPRMRQGSGAAPQLTGALILASLFATGAVAHLGISPPEGGDPGNQGLASWPLVFVQARELNKGPLDERFLRGSRLVRLWPVEPSGTVKSLTPEFFAVADPQVSYDGKRILLAAQISPDSKWQIWEMNADGSGKRKITNCEGDCLGPAYLPRQQIVFTALSTSNKFATAVFVADLDGSGSHPITFGPGAFQVEKVLENGRILVSAAYPLDGTGSSAVSRELYTLRPDGTGLTALRCNHKKKRTFRSMAEELRDGSVIFIEAPMLDGLAGALMRLDRGAIHNRSVTGHGSMLRSPTQLANGDLLVAHQGPAEGSASTPAGKFGLYTLDLSRRFPNRLVYADPEFHCLDPVVLSPRLAPKYFWSAVNPELEVGYFICLQSHPIGSRGRQELAGVPARVRVVMGNAISSATRVENEAPVESDGSFYVAVPADTPLRFQLLDKEGKVLSEQKSWIWVRPGEQRGCFGCHADRSRVPANAIPKILMRFDVPTPIGVPKTTPREAE